MYLIRYREKQNKKNYIVYNYGKKNSFLITLDGRATNIVMHKYLRRMFCL